jgi:hypothetical protein
MILLVAPITARADPIPVIEDETVSQVTAHDAILEAHISTAGIENGAWYQFQLATDPSEYANELACSVENSSLCIGVGVHPGSLPIGFVEGDVSHQTVRLDLAQVSSPLTPAATYHFRVIAARRIPSLDTRRWEPPTVFGEDQTFTTSASVPTIESESVSNVTQHDAVLEAHLGTAGLEHGAYYQFQLASDPSEYAGELACAELNSSLCIGVGIYPASLPIGFVKGDSADQLVTLDLATAGVRLRPERTYHFRVIAAAAIPSEDTTEWEPPTVLGVDQTFTAVPAQRNHPPHGRPPHPPGR